MSYCSLETNPVTFCCGLPEIIRLYYTLGYSYSEPRANHSRVQTIPILVFQIK